MKIIASSNDKHLKQLGFDLSIRLYGKSVFPTGSIGEKIPHIVRKRKLRPSPRAWDLLSIALTVIAADLRGHRRLSPDGWTRQFDITVSVTDPDFWSSQSLLINQQLGFLTTDIWKFEFVKAALPYENIDEKKVVYPSNDSVVLLSGGLDSLCGILDNVSEKGTPFAVSQIVVGDAEFQRDTVKWLGTAINHIQFNHNASIPNPETPSSQRSRSIIFLAYSVLVATCLDKYRKGQSVDVFMYENGFVSLNPPLTGARLGSLSTRTTHPHFMKLFQSLLDNAGLTIKVRNPYQFKTKGEILGQCKNQLFLKKYSHHSTSCGRFRIHGFQHCGRCLPCLVRRAAYLEAKMPDKTKYRFKNLGKNDENHRRFDDVWSIAAAILEVRSQGIENRFGATLNTTQLGNIDQYSEMIKRGLKELEQLLKKYRVV